MSTTTVPTSTTSTGTRPWLVDLTDQQREAVRHRGSDLLVVAGAGTGKTRTLTARAADLLADGVRPDRLLLLTFTRRAAAEMLGRAQAMVGSVGGSTRVTGGTFHAVAHRLLHRHARALGLHEGFSLLDEGDTVDLLSSVRRQVLVGYSSASRFPKAATLAAIMSRVANAGEPLSEVVRDRFPWCSDHLDKIREVFGAHAARKRGENLVDFDDLLLYWRALLAHPEVGARLRARWDHVLVDEYQDVNTIQAEIVEALATPSSPGGPHACVTAVGDDAQAIYAFRASSADHILSFPDRHAADVITLEQSHRCTPSVLAVANAISDGAERRHHKTLFSTRGDGPRPRLVTAHDEGDQSRSVCDAILEARERGVDLRDQAVLYRTGTHAAALEIELGARNIPYQKFGGLKFLERAHVKDLHALLRLLDNPADRLAWHRVLRLVDGIGPAWEDRITTQLGIEVWQPGQDPEASPVGRFLAAPVNAPSQAETQLELLRTAWTTCLDGGDEDRQPDPGSQVEALRGVCAALWPNRYEDATARIADVDRLAIAATRHRTRQAFLADLTLDPPVSTGDLADDPHLDDDWLTLSTIHSAKGLEWRAVHLIHAADGNLPSDMALRDKDGIEEERRLAYVAVTRARDELTVTVPLRYHKADNGFGDQHSWAQLSRFLQPIRSLFDEVVTAVEPEEPGEADVQTVVAVDLAALWAS